MKYTSKNYIKHTHPNSVFQYGLARFFRKFNDYFCQTEAKSILEIGCGEGFVLDYLAKRNPANQYFGLDIIRDAVVTASRISASLIDFVIADGIQTPFKDNIFDVVLLSEILEHVPNPDKILTESIRVSNRYILITVPREPYFQAVANFFNRFNLAEDPGHINYWKKDQLLDWLSSYTHVIKWEKCDLYQFALCEKKR